MKQPKDEFRKLQKEWYKKLKDLGFNDIEIFKDDELVLSVYKSRETRQEIKRKQLMTFEYFICLSQAVEDAGTFFRNEIDRYILRRFAEGAKIKIIVEELLERGTPKHRHTVRFIIRRYEMAWGFKYYTSNQLTFKKKA